MISKSADDALRTARKKDTGTLKLILKKIKWVSLSTGVELRTEWRL